MKLRIKFAKTGAMRFIGHLDVMRFFQKAIRRADIDIAYSGGYSPHQIMSFAAPLGVGMESRGEYMDIEVNSVPGEAKSGVSQIMTDRLNAVMVPGMEILHITRLEEGGKSAMASVAAAAYTVRTKENGETKIDWVGQINEFYSQPSIPVKKKTKKGEQEFDLKPSVFSLEAEADGTVHMLVAAGSSCNVKPGLVMEAFYRWMGGKLPESACKICREDTCAIREGEFISLDAEGKEF